MVALLLVAASLGLSSFAASVGIGASGVDGPTRLRVGIIFGSSRRSCPSRACSPGGAWPIPRAGPRRAGDRGEILGGPVLTGAGVAIAAGLL